MRTGMHCSQPMTARTWRHELVGEDSVRARCRPPRASLRSSSRRSASPPSRSSSLFPRARKLVATEPLRAMVIGAFVRGLSMARRRVAVRKGQAVEGGEVDRPAICTKLR
jgi:hypothetical protein